MEKRPPEESQQKVVKLVPREERRPSKEWQRQRDEAMSCINNLYCGIGGIINLVEETRSSAERLLTLTRAERDAQKVATPNLEKELIRLMRLLETQRAVERAFFDHISRVFMLRLAAWVDR
jgi:hypothetical protein